MGGGLDPDWVERQRHDPAARLLVAGSAGVAGGPGGLELAPLGGQRAAFGAGSDPVLLGIDAEGPLWALDEDPAEPGRRAPMIGSGGRRGEPTAEAAGRMQLREAATALPAVEAALAGYAAALLNWHRAHRHCSVCGTATSLGEAGTMRLCERCGTHHHPRTDPVVIMLVTGPDRLLLGRQSSWPGGRYSR